MQRLKLIWAICIRMDERQQNDVEAVKWYRKAAEQGNADAQANLGSMYHKGEGVKQDDVEAVKWYAQSGGAGECKGSI